MHISAMECLVYTKSFRICKKNPSMLTLTWVMPNLVYSEKNSGILTLCKTKSQFLTFSCLSIIFWPRGISGYPKHGPQSTCWITTSLIPTAREVAGGCAGCAVAHPIFWKRGCNSDVTAVMMSSLLNLGTPNIFLPATSLKQFKFFLI